MLSLLRDATRARHEALDAAVDVSTPEHYRSFLTASLAAVQGLEPRVFGSAERTDALIADLSELGAALPSPLPIEIGSRDGALGAAYVMEGSTLGGMLLATRVEGFTSATRYLRLRGKETGARWKQFLVALERDVDDRAACVQGACAAFDHYARAFRLHGVLA